MGRAVPEAHAREVAKRVPQLREAALRFQAVDQDLGKKHRRAPRYTQQPTASVRLGVAQGGVTTSVPVKDVLPLTILTVSRY